MATMMRNTIQSPVVRKNGSPSPRCGILSHDRSPRAATTTVIRPALRPAPARHRRVPLGRLQLREGGEPITDFESVARESAANRCGLVCDDIVTLIAVGITAGDLVDDGGYCAVGLSAKGQRWYERGCPSGGMLRRE